MVTAIFATSTVVCALGWLSRYISTVSLLYYLEKKGVPSHRMIKKYVSVPSGL